MALQKLATELEETVRQTRQMADEVNGALNLLMESKATCETVRSDAAMRIIVALQAQDRIEQRCVNIQSVIRQMLERAGSVDEALFADIWRGLTLDELSKPELSGSASKLPHGEPELF